MVSDGDDLYTERILDHWEQSPYRGRLDEPALSADGYNQFCGDAIHLEIALEGEQIRTVRFSGEGCIISQAAASLLAERVEGGTIVEAQRLDAATFLRDLGLTLSPARMKCALLALSVLHQALAGIAPQV